MGTNLKYWKVAGIYKLTCVNNGKTYIGKATNIGRRLNDHKNVKKDAKGNCYFQHAILKHGWNSFIVEILEIVENFDKIKDNDALLKREAYYIGLFESTDRDKGYNRCAYSSDNTGRIRSEEHKQKLRQPRSDETKEKIRQANLGKSISKEHREKISRFHLGRKRSDETKQRMSESGLGRTHTEESKAKISLAKRGIKLTEEHKEKVRQSKIGHKVSEETKQKMRNAQTDERKEHIRQLYKGKPRSEEVKEKIKQTKLKNRSQIHYVNNNTPDSL